MEPQYQSLNDPFINHIGSGFFLADGNLNLELTMIFQLTLLYLTQCRQVNIPRVFSLSACVICPKNVNRGRNRHRLPQINTFISEGHIII